MKTRKREYNPVMEKRETAVVAEKREENISHVIAKVVNCISCNKIIAEIETIEMGRVLVKCRHCGTKNRVDKRAAETGIGRYL